MSDVVSSDELNTLAAEFVLGTLDHDERKGATALLEVDHAFRGIVRIWERRLGELHLMVEAVEPDPQLWARIKPKIGGIEQVELAIPSHAAERAPESGAAATAFASAAVGDELPAEALATTTPAAAPADELPVGEATPSMPTGEALVEVAPPATEATAPSEAQSALADAELRLAELAALLPPSGQQEEPSASGSPTPEPPPPVLVDEDLLQPREPEPVSRGFVPPPPMVTRGAPMPVETVRRAGRGWIAATVLMGVIAIVLAGLIAAWRYFPERLPQPLAIDSVLNLPAPSPPPPPLPAPFDE